MRLSTLGRPGFGLLPSKPHEAPNIPLLKFTRSRKFLQGKCHLQCSSHLLSSAFIYFFGQTIPYFLANSWEHLKIIKNIFPCIFRHFEQGGQSGHLVYHIARIRNLRLNPTSSKKHSTASSAYRASFFLRTSIKFNQVSHLALKTADSSSTCDELSALSIHLSLGFFPFLFHPRPRADQLTHRW